MLICNVFVQNVDIYHKKMINIIRETGLELTGLVPIEYGVKKQWTENNYSKIVLT